MSFRTISVFAALAAMANGHMLMSSPQPYSQPALQNGPLSADGSNFPCQLSAGGSLVAGSASNTYPLGSEQALQFVGTAVHGGGSCQVSLTYDTAPNSDSVWKVIRSIEGGCPAQDQAGNMGNDANAADPYTYNFTVPDNIPAGSVTLAWTWFNKVGNREMYMNCAPVTLTGTGGSQSNFDSLPDMFVANVGNDCGTVDSTDLLFPNPGSDVVSMNGATTAFSTPTGSGCQQAGASPAAAASGGSGSGSGSGSGTTAGTSAAATTSAVSVPGGVFITATPSAAAGSSTKSAAAPAADPTSPTGTTTTSATTTVTLATSTPTAAAAATTTTAATAAATTTTAAAASSAAASGSSGSSSGSTGTQQTPGSACSPEGQWNCLGSAYQRCASGTWTVVQQLSSGTTCTGGQGSTINIVASNGKKARRVAQRFRA